MQTNPPPDEIAQRLNKMRRLVNALAISIDQLEQDMQKPAAPRTDAELAAQRARNGVYTIGPHETKVIT